SSVYFFFNSSLAHRDLHSFPTRRSSDLLPIAPGTNFRLRGSTGIEFSVQLPIVQAPFRVYYAYNVNRLHESIVAQQPFIDQSEIDRKSTRLNSSHVAISYAVFCLKKKKK